MKKIIKILTTVLLIYLTNFLIFSNNNEKLKKIKNFVTTNKGTFTVGKTGPFNKEYYNFPGVTLPKSNPAPPLPLESNSKIISRQFPAYYSLEDLGYLTPVKDQKTCGACFTFTAVAVLESIIKKATGITYDFSEQYVLSCNPYGYTCLGGMVPHDFLQDGLPLESCYPYTALEDPCTQGCEKFFTIDSWEYCNGGIESIKQAIIDHGPVWAAVGYDDVFTAYTGGVYNITTSANANHAITLVGWDDNKGSKGAWRLRNSWGTDWGEAGYMWIEYGINSVGQMANYIIYNPPTPTPLK